MKILFLHGLESSPNSYKRQKLEKMGFEVHAPALDKNSWENSVLTAREYIAPAWGKYCPWGTISSNTIIFHSKKDDIVPYSDSELLSMTFGVKLVEIGDDHRMNAPEVFEKLKCVLNYWAL